MKDKLKDINKKLIELNKENEIELKKYTFIEKILEEKNCFLKMNIETAYAILRDLKIPEENIKAVYLELIDVEK